MAALLIFFFGAAAGSFANVCIFRLPRGKSIVMPGSQCPACGTPIKWFDNVPIFSFIMLKAKCRNCKGRIPARYFLVELLTAGCFLLLYLKFSISPELFIFMIFTALLIIMGFIDIEHRIIPDELDIPGIILGLALSAVYPPLHQLTRPWDGFLNSPWLISFLSSLSGVLAGGGTLLFIAAIGGAIFKKEAMGGGDIKLIAMIGAFLGWQLALLTIFISAFLGSVIGIIMKFRTGSSYIPYGPYLACGAIISVLAGENIILWYINSL